MLCAHATESVCANRWSKASTRKATQKAHLNGCAVVVTIQSTHFVPILAEDRSPPSRVRLCVRHPVELICTPHSMSFRLASARGRRSTPGLTLNNNLASSKCQSSSVSSFCCLTGRILSLTKELRASLRQLCLPLLPSAPCPAAAIYDVPVCAQSPNTAAANL